MASSQLVEIQPKELKFTFELKKQSSCAVRLLNNTYHTVAFKVKTTSPKKYCVRPNVGVLLPKSVCEFTVTMQAQKVAPPDLVCKDKFLIQTTVVPIGTSDEDITPLMFSKENGADIEETKLKVFLVSQLSPSESPLSSPDDSPKQIPHYVATVLPEPVFTSIDTSTQVHPLTEDSEFRMLEHETSLKPKKLAAALEDTEEIKPVNIKGLIPVIKEELDNEVQLDKPKVEEVKREYDSNATEKSKPVIIKAEVKDGYEQPPANYAAPAQSLQQEPGAKDANSLRSPPPTADVKFDTVEKAAVVEPPQLLVNHVDPKLVNEIEAMKSKLDSLELKFTEAQSTISKLIEERKSTNRERKTLQEELAMLKAGKIGVPAAAEAGVPFLHVVIVALISILFGYLLRG
ncbi:unnamed protein product [Linum tenue]|uniref:MSP domain-containing protein n=1 Tax=Linum tenue TaxID=586396 RepID=A0AAV0HJJ0_9ROSI|nr:unnamed protein product [Linum tenue]